MPTAPGTAGSWYQAWVSPEVDSELQKIGLKLARQGKLLDDNGHPATVKTLPSGELQVSRYSIAKYALRQLANGELGGKK